MKKSLLFILILFGAVSLHAQKHKHYKDTIDVVMNSAFTQPDPADRNIPCNGSCSFKFGLGEAFPSTFAPFSYQWQKSEDSVAWTNVSGATIADPTLYVTGGKTYFRRIATCACGSIISNAALVTFDRPPLPKFMKYNLGADSTITDPKLQMAYLSTQTNPLDGHVFGGWYQWGRQPVDYAINPTTYLRYSGNGAANHSVAWASSMTYTNGQLDGQDDYHVYTSSNNFNWNSAQDNSLWGNGQATNIATPGTGAVLHTDGSYYQKPVKTVNDPCPSGYRVPTQNDWELMCQYDCNPSLSAGNFLTSTITKPANNSLTWVNVTCGGDDCTVSNSWGDGSSPWSGYAIYESSVWDAAPVAAGGSLIAVGAPQPLLFLPAAEYRVGSAATPYLDYTKGFYWSSSITGISAFLLRLDSSLVSPNNYEYRANGFSVRCVKCGAEPCP